MLEKCSANTPYEVLNEEIFNLSKDVFFNRKFEHLFAIQDKVVELERHGNNLTPMNSLVLSYIYYVMLTPDEHRLFPMLSGYCIAKMEVTYCELVTPTVLEQDILKASTNKSEEYYIHRIIALAMRLYANDESYTDDLVISAEELNYIVPLLRKSGYSHLNDAALLCLIFLSNYLNAVEGLSIRCMENYHIYLNNILLGIFAKSCDYKNEETTDAKTEYLNKLEMELEDL